MSDETIPEALAPPDLDTATLQALIDTIPVPFFSKRSDFRYVYCNAAFEHFVGKSRTEIAGKTVFELWDHDLATCYHEADMALFASDSEQVYEAQVKSKGGELRDVEFRKSKLSLGGQPDIWIAGTITDITEKRRLERHRDQLVEEAQAKQQLLQDFVDCSTDWVWEVNAEGQYTYVSPNVVNHLGYETQELLGKTPFDFMTKDEGARVGAAFKEYAAKREPFRDLQNINIHKNGHAVHFESSGVPNFSPSGALKGYRGVDRNVSAIVKANEDSLKAVEVLRDREARIAKSEAFFRAVVETAADAIIMIDKKGIIFSVNRGFEKMFGYCPDEVIGKNVSIIVPEPDATKHDSYIENYLNTGNAQIIGKGRTVQAIKKSSEVFPVRLAISKIEIMNELSFVGIVADLTEQKATEKELRQNETRMKDILENSSDWIWEVDERFRFTYASEKVLAHLGYTPTEIIGKTPFEFMTPESAKTVRARALEIAMNHQPFKNLESTNLSKQGHEVVIETSGTPILSESGELAGYRGANRNITEKVQATERLKELNLSLEGRVADRTNELMHTAIEAELKAKALQVAEERLETSLDFANIGAWDWDIQTGALYWSKQIAPLFGHDEKTLDTTYENFINAIHPGDRDAVLEAITNCIENSIPYNIEHRVVWPDGTVRWLHERGDCTRNSKGVATHMLGVVRDITEHKRMEREQTYANAMLEQQAHNLANIADDLETARAQAEQATEAKSAFLATMSHEIRTPINGVIGMLEVLSNSRLSPDDAKMVETITRSSHTLLGIINEILDFSKIEAGHIELEYEPMSIEEEIDQVCVLLDRVALDKGVELTMFCDPEIPGLVEGDALRLRQILTNLIGNAVKFSAGLDRVGEVSIRAELDANGADDVSVTFSVSDNGIGMDEKTLEKLFRPFEQADAGTTRRFGGTGLGLSITRSLSDMMDGDINVESKLGEGSKFSITLPFKIARVAGTRLATSNIEGLPCFVIDHEGKLGGDLECYLRHGGAHVETVSSIHSGLERVQEHTDRFGDAPVCFLVIGEPAKSSSREIVENIRGLATDVDIRSVLVSYLSVERGRRRKPRRLSDSVIQVDREVLTRRRFLDSIALAVGRIKDVETDEEVQTIRYRGKAPPRADALSAGRLILVAEDNETNQDVIVRQLALLGYAADVASNGVEALEKMNDTDYGLVMTDIQMPEMDGFELADAIRAMETRDGAVRTPILAISANLSHQNTSDESDGPIDQFLPKPVSLEYLESVLHRWLLDNAKADGSQAEKSEKPESDTVNADKGDESSNANEPAFDFAALGRLVGDDPAFKREVIASYLENLNDAIGDFEGYLENHAWIDYGKLAHKLKSTSRTFGANRLASTFMALEKAGKSEDGETVMRLHPIMMNEIADAIEQFTLENDT